MLSQKILYLSLAVGMTANAYKGTMEAECEPEQQQASTVISHLTESAPEIIGDGVPEFVATRNLWVLQERRVARALQFSEMRVNRERERIERERIEQERKKESFIRKNILSNFYFRACPRHSSSE